MCLIAFANDVHPHYRLVLAANRDEFRDRQTAPAAFWDDAPHLLAGRDCLAGGTWIGITLSGKFAAVTNYRDARQQVFDPPSRGMLAARFLQQEHMTAAEFEHELLRHAGSYDGFNLLYGTCDDLRYFTNRGGSSGPVPPGVHALSNHLLDSPWPKVVAARQHLTRILESVNPSRDKLLTALADPTPFSDALLPDTGIGLERERLLSPLFIKGSRYGTRSTTVILVGHDGAVVFAEQGHDEPGMPLRTFSFVLSAGNRP